MSVEMQVKVLKALADSTRYQILLFLLHGKQGVSAITAHVKKSQPTVSLHLKFLELSGIISSEREGRNIYYSLTNAQAKKIIKTLES